jgi:hypothetical protein
MQVLRLKGWRDGVAERKTARGPASSFILLPLSFSDAPRSRLPLYPFAFILQETLARTPQNA